MVKDARSVLQAFEVPHTRIHQELFYVDEIPPEPNRKKPAPTGLASEVTVILDGRSTTFSQPQDATVLEAAQRVRPDLPFACKGGVCGTCRAKLVKGNVEMRRNYALDPRRTRCRLHPHLPINPHPPPDHQLRHLRPKTRTVAAAKASRPRGEPSSRPIRLRLLRRTSDNTSVKRCACGNKPHALPLHD
ncbi:2Fe-2S iron-sulfur cluster-binding protein [Actinomadura sp. 9N215]|uniref:2Fe-2S iron-sulfur cluster-binding protein n=1 Tax=Actinomadura sp. 9N215 TaxID=3375150 RepID=UPI0037BC0D97